jgi:serine/threonine protein kinase
MTDFAVIESPRRFDPEIGTTIDNYLITGKLGEGTFGRVYKVEHAEGGIFALKLLKLWEVAYPKDREIIIRRFQREFELTRIDSPYLVRGQDYGKVEGNPYIVMDFCDGGSLYEYCGRVDELRNVDQIAIDVLRGLSELHQRGFFHRDIKPQNILLESEGNARVTDFGIAGNKNSTLTVRNIFGNVEQIFGTWAYIAPEQANNKVAFKALDAVADIFSFGVTMFELFTAQYPFPPYRIEDERQLAEYLANARNGNFQGLIAHQQRIPDHWLIIIRRCLEPDYAQKRWQNVKDILERLGYQPGKTAVPQYRFDRDDLCLQITYGEEMNRTYNLTQLQNLLVRNAPAPPSQIRNILTVGRKDPGVSNHIEIREDVTAYISRRHATFEVWPEHKTWVVRDGQWMAADHKWARSMNGLYLNGKAVGMEGQPIKPDDILTIGDTVLKVVGARR